MDTKIKRYTMRILCILCAIGLWLYVTYTEDPEMEIWLRGIPIEYRNMEQIDSNKLAITSQDMVEIVNIKVSGHRSALLSIQEENAEAIVDYADIKEAGEFRLPITVRLSSDSLRVVKQSTQSIACVVDKIVSIDKKVTITSSGAEALGIRAFKADPEKLTLTGPETIVNQCKINVHVDLNEKETQSSYTVNVLDGLDRPYEDTVLKMKENTVKISAIRALPIEITPSNTPQNIEIEKVEYDPQTVEVLGELTELLMLDKITATYNPWIDWGHSPSSSGMVSLSYPKTVEVLDVTSATANFYFHTKE
ncbi:MAG: hypothetical protein PUB07_02860 [Clostridia bacterium]|nr:hypothetical protein [Clostridia bacterium]